MWLPYSTDICAESTSYFIYSLRATSSYNIIWDRDILFCCDFWIHHQRNTYSSFVISLRLKCIHASSSSSRVPFRYFRWTNRSNLGGCQLSIPYESFDQLNYGPLHPKENGSQSVRDGADFGLVLFSSCNDTLVSNNPVAAEDKRRKTIKLTGAAWWMHYYLYSSAIVASPATCWSESLYNPSDFSRLWRSSSAIRFDAGRNVRLTWRCNDKCSRTGCMFLPQHKTNVPVFVA